MYISDGKHCYTSPALFTVLNKAGNKRSLYWATVNSDIVSWSACVLCAADFNIINDTRLKVLAKSGWPASVFTYHIIKCTCVVILCWLFQYSRVLCFLALKYIFNIAISISLFIYSISIVVVVIISVIILLLLFRTIPLSYNH